MKSTLTTMLLIYLGFCLLLFVLQRKLLYFPQPSGAVSGWVVNEGQPKALIYFGL